MKSKESIIKSKESVIGGCRYVARPWVLDAMTEHAQSLAKEVVEELEKDYRGNGTVSVEFAINLIKQKFNLI